MRIANRLAAILLALALLGAGVLLIAETAMVALHRPPLVVPRERWSSALANTTGGDRVVLIVSAAVLLAGAVVLILQLRPWRPVRLPADRADWFLRRRPSEHALAAAVSQLPAVSAVKVRLRRRWRLRVRAAADGRDREAVRQAAVTELQRLAAADTKRLRVRLTRRRVV